MLDVARRRILSSPLNLVGAGTLKPASPGFIGPCIPTSARRPPTDGAWLHELKIEGYRFQIIKADQQVRLFSRSGLEWTDRHSGLAAAFLRLRCRSALLDGQLVPPDSNCDLGLNPLLWTAGEEPEFVFFAFDLLHWDDDDLRSLPLAERRQHLVRLVSLSEISRLHLVQIFNDGDRLLAEAERMELQGIVSKRWAAPYKSGNSRDWIKVKTNAWRETNKLR